MLTAYRAKKIKTINSPMALLMVFILEIKRLGLYLMNKIIVGKSTFRFFALGI